MHVNMCTSVHVDNYLYVYIHICIHVVFMYVDIYAYVRTHSFVALLPESFLVAGRFGRSSDQVCRQRYSFFAAVIGSS